jgi:hypothetical protein
MIEGLRSGVDLVVGQLHEPRIGTGMAHFAFAERDEFWRQRQFTHFRHGPSGTAAMLPNGLRL